MASPFQQQSLRRKLVYIVLILVLFTATLAFRQAKSFGLEAQAKELELRDLDQGEVELTGAALRLTLTGARGFAVVILWSGAKDKMMKHEWNQLELLVKSVSKLQPHFITPWLFQSWNLAYNVSVESDRILDKFYYITRGIQLLAEGERQNKINPDLRFSMGFYNQQKIGLADEANTFRSLFQMGCIDPLERSAKRLRSEGSSGRQVVNGEEFEKFCKNHPMLVRRLREVLKRDTPDDVVDFLVDNQKVPSRFEEKIQQSTGGQVERSPLKPLEKQFPVLPPLDTGDKGNPDDKDFDNFTLARDWYTYAVQPLPPRKPEDIGPYGWFDRKLYRMPRYITDIIFRQYPARSQTYVGEYLEKEGWFDGDGWSITGGWFPEDRFGNSEEAKVGADTSWGKNAWAKAHDMWKSHGTTTGLYLETETINNLEERAQKYRKEFGLTASSTPRELREDLRGGELEDSYRAHKQLYWYGRDRQLTNFPHFYTRSAVEADSKGVAARKAFFAAEQLRKVGNREQALKVYRDILPGWKDIMVANPAFGRDLVIQEDTYEIELKYLDLIRDLNEKWMKGFLIAVDHLCQSALSPHVPGISWTASPLFAKRMALPVATPFEELDASGNLVVGEEARFRVRMRLGLPYVDPTFLRPPEASGKPGPQGAGAGSGQ